MPQSVNQEIDQQVDSILGRYMLNPKQKQTIRRHFTEGVGDADLVNEWLDQAGIEDQDRDELSNIWSSHFTPEEPEEPTYEAPDRSSIFERLRGPAQQKIQAIPGPEAYRTPQQRRGPRDLAAEIVPSLPPPPTPRPFMPGLDTGFGTRPVPSRAEVAPKPAAAIIDELPPPPTRTRTFPTDLTIGPAPKPQPLKPLTPERIQALEAGFDLPDPEPKKPVEPDQLSQIKQSLTEKRQKVEALKTLFDKQAGALQPTPQYLAAKDEMTKRVANLQKSRDQAKANLDLLKKEADQYPPNTPEWYRATTALNATAQALTEIDKQHVASLNEMVGVMQGASTALQANQAEALRLRSELSSMVDDYNQTSKNYFETLKKEVQKQGGLQYPLPPNDIGRITSNVNSLISSAIDTMIASPLKSVGIAAYGLDKLTGGWLAGDRKKIDDYATYQLGSAVERGAKQLFATNPAFGKEFLTTLSEGAGSMLGFIGTGLATRMLAGVGAARLAPAAAEKAIEAAQFAGTAISGAMTAGPGAFEAAKAAGADDSTAFKAFLVDSGFGTLEVLPIERAFSRLNKITDGAAMKVLKNAAVGSIEEGVQELIQAFGSNIVPKLTYDPERGLWEGVLPQAGAGGILGGAMNALISSIGVARARRLHKQVADQLEAELTGIETELDQKIDQQTQSTGTPVVAVASESFIDWLSRMEAGGVVAPGTAETIGGPPAGELTAELPLPPGGMPPVIEPEAPPVTDLTYAPPVPTTEPLTEIPSPTGTITEEEFTFPPVEGVTAEDQQRRIAAVNLPPGYRIEFRGTQEGVEGIPATEMFDIYGPGGTNLTTVNVAPGQDLNAVVSERLETFGVQPTVTPPTEPGLPPAPPTPAGEVRPWGDRTVTPLEPTGLRGTPVPEFPNVYEIGPGMGGVNYNVILPDGRQTTLTVSSKPGQPGLAQRLVQLYQQRGYEVPADLFEAAVTSLAGLPSPPAPTPTVPPVVGPPAPEGVAPPVTELPPPAVPIPTPAPPTPAPVAANEKLKNSALKLAEAAAKKGNTAGVQKYLDQATKYGATEEERNRVSGILLQSGRGAVLPTPAPEVEPGVPPAPTEPTGELPGPPKVPAPPSVERKPVGPKPADLEAAKEAAKRRLEELRKKRPPGMPDFEIPEGWDFVVNAPRDQLTFAVEYKAEPTSVADVLYVSEDVGDFMAHITPQRRFRGFAANPNSRKSFVDFYTFVASQGDNLLYQQEVQDYLASVGITNVYQKELNNYKRKFGEALADVAQGMGHDPSRPIVVVKVSPGLSDEALNRTLAHELAHIYHFLVAMDVSRSIVNDEFLTHPLVQRLRSQQLLAGYDNQTLKTEIPARIAAGQFDTLGYTLDEATEVYKNFLDLAFEKHGDKAYKAIGGMIPMMRDAVREAFAKAAGGEYAPRPIEGLPEPPRGKRPPEAPEGLPEGREGRPEEGLGGFVDFEADEAEPDLEVIEAMTDAGKAYMQNGLTDPAAWRAQVLEDFSDFRNMVEPHLDLIYEMAKDAFIAEGGTVEAPTPPAEEPTAAPPEPPVEESDEVRRARTLVNAFVGYLRGGRKLNNINDLIQVARDTLGGGWGTAFTEADIYDAVETAVNTVLMESPGPVDFGDFLGSLERIDEILQLIPSRTSRETEQIKLQQFSTPPSYSMLVASVSGAQPSMRMLEPSAGNGSLAIMGRLLGAIVDTNEISERRLNNLRVLGFNPTNLNAEVLDSLLAHAGNTTMYELVMMNPPFSASLLVKEEANKNRYGMAHLKNALRRVKPGGRLVAILPEGLAHETSGLWVEIENQYTIRANVGLNREVYKKQGTTFPTRIVVIDNTGPTPGTDRREKAARIIRADNQSIEQTYQLLRGIGDENVLERVRTAEKGRLPTESSGGIPVPPDAGLPPDIDIGGPGAGPEGVGPGVPGGELGGVPEPTPGGGVEGGPGPVTGVGPDTGLPPPPVPVGGEPGGPGVGQPEPTVEREAETAKVEEPVYTDYKVEKFRIYGARPHPAHLVQSTIMSSVQPPDSYVTPDLPNEVIRTGRISLEQLEAIAYALQRFEVINPDGSRAGFWLGDGTGTGKTRTIAGIIWHHYRKTGQKKALWISTKTELAPEIESNLKKPEDAQDDGIGMLEDVPFYRHHDGVFDIRRKDRAGKDHPNPIPKEIEGILYSTYGKIRDAFTDRGSTPIVHWEQKPDDAAIWDRFEQVARWLGRDFDGVIVFDEAHFLKNAVATTQGGRAATGSAVGSLQGRLAVQFQALFPQARIIYASATGATEARNMGYMTRMGLWSMPGAPFPDFPSFLTAMHNGGIGMMENLARDMKAIGASISRSIAYRGRPGDPPEQNVEYGILEHKLDDADIEMYNTLSNFFARLFQKFKEAADDENGPKKMLANSQIFGTQQRFFLQVMLSLQIPTMLKKIDEDLATDKSVIINVYSTSADRTEKEVRQAREEGVTDFSELELTPKGMLTSLLERHFPIYTYVDETDPATGKTIRVPLLDADGNPVINQENLRRRNELIEEIADLRMPDNPLDRMIRYFREEKGIDVSELTGRDKHLVMVERPDGRRELDWIPRRPDGIAKKQLDEYETRRFMEGVTRVAFISRKSAAGISLHASIKVDNQQRRVMYSLELPWSADTFIQAVPGRGHRSAQTSAPIVRLVKTDVRSQQRFINTVARRLASLGAFTEGSRESKGGQLFEIEDFTDQYGETALLSTWTAIINNKIPERDAEGNIVWEKADEYGEREPKYITAGVVMLERLGVLDADQNIRASAMEKVEILLNRIMALTFKDQNAVFDYFYDAYQALVREAKERGEYDLGVTKLQGTNVRLAGDPMKPWQPEEGIPVARMRRHPVTGVPGARIFLPPPPSREQPMPKEVKAPEVIYTHPESGAKTRLVELEVDHKQNKRTWEASKNVSRDGYVMNVASGRIYAVVINRNPEQGRLDYHGDKPTMAYPVYRYSPSGKQSDIEVTGGGRGHLELDDPSKYTRIDFKDAQKLWEDEFAKHPEYETRKTFLVTGAIIPIYNVLVADASQARQTIVRAVLAPNAWKGFGASMIGLQVSPRQVPALRRRLGLEDTPIAKATPTEVWKKLKDGSTIKLNNGWDLKHVSVRKGLIELRFGKEMNVRAYENELRQLGLRDLTLDASRRWFLPQEEGDGVPVLENLLKVHPPIEEVLPPVQAAQQPPPPPPGKKKRPKLPPPGGPAAAPEITPEDLTEPEPPEPGGGGLPRPQRVFEAEPSAEEELAEEELPAPPARFGSSNTLFTEEVADRAKERLRKKLGGNVMFTGLDPEILADMIKVGGFYFEGGLRDFTDWSSRMIETFNQGIQPYLEQIFSNVKQAYIDSVESQVEEVVPGEIMIGQDMDDAQLARLMRPTQPRIAVAAPDPNPPVRIDPKRMSLSQTISELATGLKTKVHRARVPRGAKGVFYPGSAATVTKYWGDFDTTMHELGHFLDSRFQIVGAWAGARRISPFDSELMGNFAVYGSASPNKTLMYNRAEGVAEWIRAWVFNPEQAVASAPRFAAFFMTKVPPEIRDEIQKFGHKVRQWSALDPEIKSLANVHHTMEQKNVFTRLHYYFVANGLDFETRGWDRLRAGFENKAQPWRKMLDYAEGKQKEHDPNFALIPERDPRVRYGNFSGIGQKAAWVIENGMIRPDPQRKDIKVRSLNNQDGVVRVNLRQPHGLWKRGDIITVKGAANAVFNGEFHAIPVDDYTLQFKLPAGVQAPPNDPSTKIVVPLRPLYQLAPGIGGGYDWILAFDLLDTSSNEAYKWSLSQAMSYGLNRRLVEKGMLVLNDAEKKIARAIALKLLEGLTLDQVYSDPDILLFVMNTRSAAWHSLRQMSGMAGGMMPKEGGHEFEMAVRSMSRYGRPTEFPDQPRPIGQPYSVFMTRPQEPRAYSLDQIGRWEQVFNRYNTWSDANLRYWVGKGRLSMKAYLKIKEKNEEYFAMNRILHDGYPELGIGMVNPGILRALTEQLGQQANPLRYWKGGTPEIQNPFLSLLAQTYAFIREADRNEILSLTADMLETERGMYDGPLVQMALAGMRLPGKQYGAVSIYRRGKEEFWKFEEGVEDFLENWGAVENSNLLFRTVKMLLKDIPRRMFTSTPGFVQRSVMREATTRAVVSETGSQPWDVFFPYSPEEREAYLLAGGSQEPFSVTNIPRMEDYLINRIREVVGPEKRAVPTTTGGRILESIRQKGEFMVIPFQGLKGGITKGMRRYVEWVKEWGEIRNRMAEYRSAYRKARAEHPEWDRYNAHLWAVHQAREILDYYRVGFYLEPILRFLPFTGTNIQSKFKLMRSFRDEMKEMYRLIEAKDYAGWTQRAFQKGFFGRFALYVLLPRMLMLLWHYQDDDEWEEYKGLPLWRRMFVNVRVKNPVPETEIGGVRMGGGHLWVPIPQGWELGFGALVAELIAQEFIGQNKDTWKEMVQGAANTLIPIDDFMFTGPPRGVLENLMNRSIFFDRYIVPPGEEELAFERRDPTRGSRLGRAFENVSIALGWGVDARKWDNFIYSLTGSLGYTITNISDIGAKPGAGWRAASALTGVAFEPAGYAAPDVQWVLRKAKEMGDTQSAEIRRLGTALKRHREGETIGERETRAREVRSIAREIRAFYEAVEQDLMQLKITKDKIQDEIAAEEREKTPAASLNVIRSKVNLAEVQYVEDTVNFLRRYSTESKSPSEQEMIFGRIKEIIGESLPSAQILPPPANRETLRKRLEAYEQLKLGGAKESNQRRLEIAHVRDRVNNTGDQEFSRVVNEIQSEQGALADYNRFEARRKSKDLALTMKEYEIRAALTKDPTERARLKDLLIQMRSEDVREKAERLLR